MTDEIVRLVGIYDAEGSFVGEVSYFLRARIGRAHCALCDVTHGRVRERPAWRTARRRLGAPFITFHRDDQPAEIRRAAGGAAPAVIAETAAGEILVLLGGDELECCGSSPDRLVDAIEAAVAARGLHWRLAAG